MLGYWRHPVAARNCPMHQQSVGVFALVEPIVDGAIKIFVIIGYRRTEFCQIEIRVAAH